MKGYLAVVLDRQSHAEVAKLATHKKLHAHHVTLAFNIHRKDFDVEGQFVSMTARWLYKDDKADALTVALDKNCISLCRNKYSHVTLSTSEGTKPSYSNELIEKSQEGKSIGDVPLTGVIKFIPFEPQPLEFRRQEKLRIAAAREKPKHLK